MVGSSSLLALAGLLGPALSAYAGFNYGSTFTTGAAKAQSDFEAEFKAAQALIGAPDVFNSARLYTMIQAGTANTVISAIPAAISTKTSLLLGMWASAGDASFANELQALKTAIQQFGSQMQVAGISVGSEDLYRISPIGILNKENPGASPATIANYISQVKQAISGTPLAGVPVGHVDTWTAWVNGTNQPVIDGCDWIGVDTYPYFQNTEANSIDVGKQLFDAAISATAGAVGGKPIWVTETGWPVGGPNSNQAVPSIQNAQTYWDQVGCELFGTTNTWWYTIQDAAPDTPSPSFGIVGSNLNGPPLYNLTCPAVSKGSTGTTSSGSSSGSGSTSSASGSSGSGSGSSSQSSTVSAPVSLSTGGAGVGGSGSGMGSTGAGNSIPTPTGSSSSSSSTGSSSSGSSGSGSGSSSTTQGSTGSGSGSTSSTGATSSTTGVATAGASMNVASYGAGVIAALLAVAL